MSIGSEMVLVSAASPVVKSAAKDPSDVSARIRPGSSAPVDSAVRVDPSLQRIVDRVTSNNASPERQSTAATVGLAPGNGRYSLFVDAVQALRLDKTTAAELTPERVAELKAAAAEVFQIRTGIPREQSPIEALAEQRAIETEKAAKAEAAKARATAEASDARSADAAGPTPEIAQAGAQVGSGHVDASKPEAPAIPAPVVAGDVPDAPDLPDGSSVSEPTVATPASSAPASDVGAKPSPFVAQTPVTPSAETVA